MITQIADRLILQPTRNPISTLGKQRRVINYTNGFIEAWTQRIGTTTSEDADVFVLKFAGTDERAERTNHQPLSSWPDLRGEVWSVDITAPNGERFTLAMLKDGDIFGAMSFVDGRPRSATIIAASEVETIVMEKSVFESIIDENPRLIHKILSKIIFSVHSIVRAMNARYLEMINYMWGRKRFT